MKLPHERDQNPHPPGPPKEITARGARDVAQGRTDTDCYGSVGERYDRKQGGR
jgi:hypothetical protein